MLPTAQSTQAYRAQSAAAEVETAEAAGAAGANAIAIAIAIAIRPWSSATRKCKETQGVPIIHICPTKVVYLVVA